MNSRVPRRPHVPYQVWFGLMWASAGLLVLAALGEYLGWWRDLGLFLALVSLGATVVFGFTAATARTVAQVGEEIADLGDKVNTGNVILERIERLLADRLPRQ